MKAIEDAIEEVRERIRKACARSARDEKQVRLLGVTKGISVERIKQAISCGINDFGENYIQEAVQKIPLIEGDQCWHMIGHIQTNKVKFIPKFFSVVHSVDRWETLVRLDTYGKKIDVLFELNLSEESSKHGTNEDGLKRILERVQQLQSVRPTGLMTMAPYVENPEQVRNIFCSLREIKEKVNKEFGLKMSELSMGMSSDFEVAIEEGATMVRIGTALFGERMYGNQ